MKLLRYGKVGSEKPGIVDSEGKIRDLSNVLPDIDAGTLSDEGLNNIRKIDLQKLPEANDNDRIGCPVANVGKLICIGLNYSDHAEQQLVTYMSQMHWNMLPDTQSAMMFLKENGNLNTEVNGRKEKASTRSLLLVRGWLPKMKLKILITFPCGWISMERGCRLGTRIP